MCLCVLFVVWLQLCAGERSVGSSSYVRACVCVCDKKVDVE